MRNWTLIRQEISLVLAGKKDRQVILNPACKQTLVGKQTIIQRSRVLF